MESSIVHSSYGPREVGSFKLGKDEVAHFESLAAIGYGLDASVLSDMVKAYGMDAAGQATVTTAGIPTPIQFLQAWLPGHVAVATAARKIDEIVGIATVGSWEDEEVVQSLLEHTGSSVVYGDYTNVPLSSWNLNYVKRTIVPFEEGMQVGVREGMRAGRVNINSAAEKRNAATTALDIRRNQVGFTGYNSGNNLTYGFLNDPGLPAYVTVANGAAASPLWSSKTFAEIQKDIVTWISTLRNSSKDLVDPDTTPITMALATVIVDRLATTATNGSGQSVRQWLKETYPNIRVVSAPELNGANSGANVGYLFAESISDMSTDDGRTFIQMVPTRFMTVGVEQKAKNYVEDYSNATAGVMCKRPFLVYRASGM